MSSFDIVLSENDSHYDLKDAHHVPLFQSLPDAQ
jgi:hypothetical protein